ncbi:spore germination protein [Paenibacillus oryzisoli]|uniref:spore germination protein n=1 Tax=Paenibacillus oryzisoli TaxID=1850517 RepID=UPI003D299AD9
MDNKPPPISGAASENIALLQQVFSENELLTVRELRLGREQGWAFLVYLNVLIDEKALNQVIIRKINEDWAAQKGLETDANDMILDTLQSVSRVTARSDMESLISAMMNSGVAVFLEGQETAYDFFMPEYEKRAIDEPNIEINVRGPRESFIEDLTTNISMVFRKLRTPELKTVSYTIGSQSRTKVTLLYLDDKVDKRMLDELKARLAAVRLDVLIANTQIEEFIQDSSFTPFPQIFATERPDRVVTALNRGKIAIMTDGTPIVLIAPTSFFEMLHTSDDLYERFYFANFLRGLRLIAMFISLFGPSLYIALTTFHLEMIPTPLMLAFLSSKAGIPFPTFVEAMLMEIAFEVLREASLRLPRAVGQSVSIVGALIIGEAAVQSGIVSRPMVIVVAMTGIASFTIPNFSTAISFRLLRFPMMLLAAYTGVLGISLGMFILLSHLCSLTSCGKLFLSPVSMKGWRDTLKKYVLLPIRLRNPNSGGSHQDDVENT